jgi:hypothetical protein
MLRYVNKTPKSADQSVNSEISRIVSAAVVNKHFCSKMLSNPSSAISQGYCGEPFSLTSEQKGRIAMIKENSLEGFAAQLAQI